MELIVVEILKDKLIGGFGHVKRRRKFN